jgi:heme/copper-type cytochrome/quinol oxidase subunit 4
MERGPAVSSQEKRRQHTMETEIIGITLAAVLPVYPLLIAIYQKMGRYDEIVEEFKRLRDEHDQVMEGYHGA